MVWAYGCKGAALPFERLGVAVWTVSRCYLNDYAFPFNYCGHTVFALCLSLFYCLLIQFLFPSHPVLAAISFRLYNHFFLFYCFPIPFSITSFSSPHYSLPLCPFVPLFSPPLPRIFLAHSLSLFMFLPCPQKKRRIFVTFFKLSNAVDIQEFFALLWVGA